MFSIVVACTQEGGIAKEGRIPWNIPSDMRHFYLTTTKSKESVVIMGRKTWESLPRRPLKDRINIVVSESSRFIGQHPLSVSKSLEGALQLATKAREVFVIGGAMLYEEAIRSPRCKSIIVTIIHDDIPCDRFFPLQEMKKRFLKVKHIREKTVENGYTFHISEYAILEEKKEV